MKTIWLLIYIHHGLIQEPEIFFDKNSAIERKFILLKNINPDYDELEIFEKQVW
jgi:hypothetical protein